MAAANVSSINNITFYSNVTGPAEARYQEKVELCGFDPYLLNKMDRSEELAKFLCVIVEYSKPRGQLESR